MPARGFTLDLTVNELEEARAGFRALGEEGERSLRRPAEGARDRDSATRS